MKFRVYLSAALFSIFFLFRVIFPALLQGAPPGMIGYGQGDYLDVSKQTWVEYPTPLKDPLGHPTRPWQPKGEYPWKQPYSAPMLMYSYPDNCWPAGSRPHWWSRHLAGGKNFSGKVYFLDDHELYATKYQNASLMSLRLNKRGMLTQRKGYVARETLYDNYISGSTNLFLPYPCIVLARCLTISQDGQRRKTFLPSLPGLCRTVYPSVELLGQTVHRSTTAAASSSAPPSFLATGKIIRYNPLYEEPNYIT